MAKTIKAKVAPVKFGVLEIEGLLLPNGDFAIAVVQVAALFQFDTNQASRTLKPLLGEGFQFDTATSELHPKKVNVLSLKQFELILMKLAWKGNTIAQELQSALVGLSLVQVFSDAFDIQFDKQDRQAWLNARLNGVDSRNDFTDLVDEQYRSSHGLSADEKVPFYAFSNPSDLLNSLFTGHPAKYWREYFNIKTNDELRSHWSSELLNQIKATEDLAARLMASGDQDPCSAILEAFNRLMYKQMSEDEVTGRFDASTQVRKRVARFRAKQKQQAV